MALYAILLYVCLFIPWKVDLQWMEFPSWGRTEKENQSIIFWRPTIAGGASQSMKDIRQ
jgi:hypothetical protein